MRTIPTNVFTPPGTGGTARPFSTKLAERLSVTDYGGVADDATDNNAAVLATIDNLPSTGGVVFFPAAALAYRIVGTLPTNRKSNIIFRGAGMGLSTVKTISGATPLWSTSGTAVAQNVAWENLGFETGGTNALILEGAVLRGRTRVSRCRFGDTYGITANGMADLTVEESLFYCHGTAKWSGFLAQLSCKRITLRGNVFRYLLNSIIFDSNSAGGASQEMMDDIHVINNRIDSGWYTLKEDIVGTGAAAYAATTVTDTGVNFTTLPITVNATVRVMPTLRTGTGVFAGVKVTDASASFISQGVKRGHIIRTGTSFAVVSHVEAATILWVEEWLSDSTRLPVGTPAGGTYTVYDVWIGKINTVAATVLTVNRWHDFDGTTKTNAAPQGDATHPFLTGTRYEVARSSPNYPIHFTKYTRHALIQGNHVIRGWTDNINFSGTHGRILDNDLQWGQDMGITIEAAQNCIVSGNSVYRMGTHGIVLPLSAGGATTDVVVAGNLISDCEWINALTTLNGGIVVQQSSRNLIVNNKIVRITSANQRHGVLVYGDGGGAATANIVQGNTAQNMVAEGFVARGANADQTVFSGNTGGTTTADTGATNTQIIDRGLPVQLQRTISLTNNNWVEIGSFALGNGSAVGSFWITAISRYNLFDVSKQYAFSTFWHSTAGAWQRVIPLTDTGINNGNDFALDINVSSGTVLMRIRRTATDGVNGGPIYVTMRMDGLPDAVFTPTSATGGPDAITATYAQTMLSPAAGGLKIGEGTAITKLVVYTPTLSPAAVAANTTAEQTFTVTGLTTADKIIGINKPTTQAGLGIVGYRVSATDTLAITFANVTGSSITPTASQVYQVVALRS